MPSLHDVLACESVYWRLNSAELAQFRQLNRASTVLFDRLELYYFSIVRDNLHPRLAQQVLVERRVLCYRLELSDSIADHWSVLSIVPAELERAPLHLIAVEED
eukprot:5333810-Karenia_brevis.AAC.1